MASLDLSQNWQIVLAQPHPTANLAARELQAYLSRINGRQFGIYAQPTGDKPFFSLSYEAEEDDGFERQVFGRLVELKGCNPRGLLFAVYNFLEALGCCWFAPGESGEHIPHGTHFELPQDTVREQPALPGRCLIIAHHAFMQDVADWIVWAGRNRLNTIFFHTIDSPMAVGAVHESQYQSSKPLFLPLMHERGMTLEHGGHGLTDKLPRRLFERMPEAFRFHDGRRTPDYNFCPTSPQGLEVIRQNVEKLFRSHPEVDVFHLWADDIAGGGWCSCATCQPYTASEQLLLATNALAEVLEKVNPAAQISFIAYHDTEALPARVQPRPNVALLWAPRMRCYAHGSEDAACRLNVPRFNQTQRQQVAYFRTAGAAPARVFEYYLDAVLFKSVLPPLPSTMQADVRFYRDAGVHTLQALMTGDYAWTTAELNPWLFARLCWNPEQDLDALITRFSLAAFGADLLSYYRTLENAFALALDIVPEQAQINVSRGDRTIWDSPPTDMGDPFFAPLPVLVEKSKRSEVLQALIRQAEGYLRRFDVGANHRLRQERAHFALLKSWLQFDLNRVQLYTALSAGTPRRQSLQHWKQTRKAFNAVLRWGRRNIVDRKHRINFHYIQFYTWGIRLNKIYSEHFAGALGKKWLTFSILYHLKRIAGRVRKLYVEKQRTINEVINK